MRHPYPNTVGLRRHDVSGHLVPINWVKLVKRASLTIAVSVVAFVLEATLVYQLPVGTG